VAKSVPLVRTEFLNQRGDPKNATINGLTLRLRGRSPNSAAGQVLDLAVQSAVMSWALNTIPTASVTVNVGISTEELIRSGDGLTQTGKLVEFLRGLTPDSDEAEIWASPQGDFDDIGTPWPEEGVLVFKGFIAGQPSMQVVSGRVVSTLPLRHVLSKLTYSSALSAVYHQAFPWSFAAPLGGFADYGGKQGACNISEMIGHGETSQGLAEDVWGAIKKLLVSVCLVPVVQQKCLIEEDLGSLPINEAGLVGLAAIEGPSPEGQDQYSREYKSGGPTTLQGEAALHPKVLTTIADFVVKSQAELFSAHDLWSLLIGVYLPQLGLVLAPTADGAVVLPDASSLAPFEVHRTLYADEQFAPNLVMAEGRLIKGIIVLADSLAEYNVQAGGIAGDARPALQCAGGAYVEPELPGSILPIPAPLWLSRIESADGFALSTTGLKDGVPVRNDVKPEDVPLGPDQPEEHRDTVRDLFDAYAKSVFVTERLRGRRGSLTGMLRFDIGPGSIVKIERENDLFSGVDAATTDLYGYVYQATIAISADPPSATTTFGISNLRDASEVLDGPGFDDTHPLYGKVETLGVPIVPDYPVVD
jgi:hypothetical protein